MGFRSPAARRYGRRFFPSMVAYVIVLMSATWFQHAWHPTGLKLVLLAIAPAVPLLAVIAIMGLYLLDEEDEFIRRQAVVSMIGATGILLAVATVAGFLQNAGVIPTIPAFWAFVVWCSGLGAIQCWQKLRDRVRP